MCACVCVIYPFLLLMFAAERVHVNASVNAQCKLQKSDRLLLSGENVICMHADHYFTVLFEDTDDYHVIALDYIAEKHRQYFTNNDTFCEKLEHQKF